MFYVIVCVLLYLFWGGVAAGVASYTDLAENDRQIMCVVFLWPVVLATCLGIFCGNAICNAVSNLITLGRR